MRSMWFYEIQRERLKDNKGILKKQKKMRQNIRAEGRINKQKNSGKKWEEISENKTNKIIE